jgi:hypothetical protein
MQDALAAYPSTLLAVPLVHMYMAVGDHPSASAALATVAALGPSRSTDTLKVQLLLRTISQGSNIGITAFGKLRAKSAGSARKRRRSSFGTSLMESSTSTSRRRMSSLLGSKELSSRTTAMVEATEAMLDGGGYKRATALMSEGILMSPHELGPLLEVCSAKFLSMNGIQKAGRESSRSGTFLKCLSKW